MADSQPTSTQSWWRTAGAGIAAGAAGLLVLLALIGVIVVYTGAYNVAATEEHASITRWAFETTQHSSVERRAADVTPPETFTPEMIKAGASEYQAMCQHCHAGPGVDRAEWAEGMRPTPPHLKEEAAHWDTSELFWIVKHGIKMSGMPAFGPTHDDQTIWNIAAFLEKLPAMTPERYASLAARSQDGGGHAESGH